MDTSLEVLMSMYSNDKSAVKIENNITQTFLCHNGVKQGCMLSPTLFNIYLSDLPEMLNIASTTEVMLRERPTNCLLYADDLVIFARSAEGLQRILNKLKSFCEKVDLTVSLDKTKVMIFNNSGKSLNNYSFKYGTNKLENAKSYRYLGLTLCPYGNFTLARQELKKASLKVLFKTRAASVLNGFKNIPEKACPSGLRTMVPIHYLHKPIMQSVLGGSLHKNNTSSLLLGLYHASVNRISIVLMQITPQNRLHYGIVQVVNCERRIISIQEKQAMP